MFHSISHEEPMDQKHSINLCNHERYPVHLKCLRNIQKIKYPDFQAMTYRTHKDGEIDIMRQKRDTGIQYRPKKKEDVMGFIPKPIAHPEYGTVLLYSWAWS